MERGKIDAEYAELMTLIAELTDIIENEKNTLRSYKK
jgi:DNA gyrase/topoisomerase IV subunit A